MRRSAAAFLGRPAAASTQAPLEGVEAVRAAAAAAVLAVDSKLAAVRATVSGGHVAPAADPPPGFRASCTFHTVPGSAHSAAGAGNMMSRSGSEPELRGWLATPPARNCATLDPAESAAAVDSIVAGAMHGVQRAAMHGVRLQAAWSCLSIVECTSSAASGPAPAASDSGPTQQAGHPWMRGGGVGGGDRRAEAASGQWRQLPLGQKPPPATLFSDAGGGSGAEDSAGDCAVVAAVNGKMRQWRQLWRQPATSSSSQAMPLSLGIRGGGGGAQDAVPDDSAGEGRLSPRGPGPMLAGRGGRGMGRT